MDWIYILLQWLKAFHSVPIIHSHHKHTLVVGSGMHNYSCPGADWQKSSSQLSSRLRHIWPGAAIKLTQFKQVKWTNGKRLFGAMKD